MMTHEKNQKMGRVTGLVVCKLYSLVCQSSNVFSPITTFLPQLSYNIFEILTIISFPKYFRKYFIYLFLY